ncbi:MAG: hypothetical protein AAF384_16025 [Pseudomonadota bacterium]
MNTENQVIAYRMMTADDIDSVPIGCQGEVADVRARIRDVGSAAVLGFDGTQHVAQLQFRRYQSDLRSSKGLWDPAYWGDFAEHAPDLPHESINVFCYHVGQLEDTEDRDPRYQGRGIGLAMLDELIVWATNSGFATMVATYTPPDRAVMGFMGGQALESYAARGFQSHASWIDEELYDVLRQRNLIAQDADASVLARVGCCVKNL